MAGPRRGATLGRTATVLVLTLALTVVAVASVAGAAAVGTPQPETDSTVTRITVAENGTATWEVQVRTRLTSGAEVEDYEAFQASFRENTSQYLDTFRRSMRGVVATAENETGREMRAVQFTASTSVQAAPRRWGIVSYRFRWTNFAVRDGDALVMGDVFGGEFLLTENDTLAIVAPDDYRVADVTPDAAQRTDERVRWYGRRIFADGRPSVRFEPAASATGTPDGDGPGGTPTNVSSGGGGGIGFPLAAVAVVALVVVALGAYRYVEHAGLPGRGPPTASGDDGSSAGGAGSADGAVADSSSPGGDGAAATSGVTPGSAGGTDSGAAGDPGEADDTGETDEASETSPAPATGDADPADESASDIDPEPVITDAERVEELLAEHDGQLHQSDVVDALGWSKSKTSRVLSEMAEEETIEKLRIGRRNVIRLDSADAPDEGE